MKWRPMVVLILLSVGAMIASAQSSTEDRALAHETQVRGNWVDPSSGIPIMPGVLRRAHERWFLVG